MPQHQTAKSEPVFKSSDEAAELLRLHPGTLRRLRAAGKGPKYGRAGSKVLYRVDDLLAWVESGANQ